MPRLSTSICLDLEESVEMFRKYGTDIKPHTYKILRHYLTRYDGWLQELRDQGANNIADNYCRRRDTALKEFPELQRLDKDAQQLKRDPRCEPS